VIIRDLRFSQPGLSGGVGEQAEVDGRVGLQRAAGGPEQSGVTVSLGLPRDSACQTADVSIRDLAGFGSVRL
jgi:hypothetical protein